MKGVEPLLARRTGRQVGLAPTLERGRFAPGWFLAPKTWQRAFGFMVAIDQENGLMRAQLQKLA